MRRMWKLLAVLFGALAVGSAGRLLEGTGAVTGGTLLTTAFLGVLAWACLRRRGTRRS
ncbi:hypothetical protein [Streptomyces sp. ODS05-4]|uniref:hypothetical protein n=1 Tax=Streptomyces sp. ODS05-4 TaxID=2944939 RepID=UPI00210D3340|nr:hypothetical protein [Streptomyces sp. ODS05-4]